MLFDRDDLTLQRMDDSSKRPRWVIYGVLAVVILAPIAAWLVRRHGAPPVPATPTAAPGAVVAPTPAASTSAPPAAATKPGPVPAKPPVAAPAAVPPAVSPATPSAPATAPTAAPAVPGSDQGQAMLARFRGLLAEHRQDDARALGYQILSASKDPAAQAEAEQLLGTLNMALLFSPAAMPEKEDYTVQKGDSLDRIAKKYGTTVDLLRESNQLKGDRINLGDRLRVFTGACTLHVSKTRNDLELRVNDRFFKRYRVGTGKFGKTPVGTFAIEVKLKDPPWTRPADKKIIPYGDPANVLGTRWMSIRALEGTEPVDGYGLHGTIEPETVGKQSSDGCIRMVNADVEEVYKIVPEGTRVVITE